MNAIRVQIHLKHMFDENVSNELYNFWYAFHPSKRRTIKDLIDDLQENYLKPQLSLLTNKIDLNDQQTFMIELDQCQLLPFSSSQILRDNDRLTLTPLTKYKLHKKTLQDSVQFTQTSVLPVQSNSKTNGIVSNSVAVVNGDETNDNEKSTKRQRTESIEQNKTIEANISVTETQPSSLPQMKTTTMLTNPDEEKSNKKKKKTMTNEESLVVSPVEPTAPVQISEAEKNVEKETPEIVSSRIGRLREIRSKTPKWKSHQPIIKENSAHAKHIRFDSDSEEEEEEDRSTISIEKTNDVDDRPTSEIEPVVQPSNNLPKKTLDLLFEMKQCKNPTEKQAKKIKQDFAKRRAQHRKRAITSLALANYVDQAFGLDRATLEKQISSNEKSTTTENLPNSFNKLARLPLVANAIETNDKIYDLYPPVEQCPSIQTRIAFKLLELSDDFCPKLSEFKEAIVIDVNSSNGELTLQLDQPLTTVFDQPSKFYAPDDDQSIEESTTVTLLFSELQSVRLISTTTITTNENNEK